MHFKSLCNKALCISNLCATKPYRNSDFFFANYIIFAESKNDVEVIKFLAKSKNIDLDLYGISLINIDGIKNLPYPFHVVRNLNLPYTIILDKDYFIPYLNDELDSSGFVAQTYL